MATTQELQTQLEELNTAIGNGALVVTFSSPGGASRSVTYRSLSEMLRARADIERRLGAGTTRLRRGRTTFTRGL